MSKSFEKLTDVVNPEAFVEWGRKNSSPDACVNKRTFANLLLAIEELVSFLLKKRVSELRLSIILKLYVPFIQTVVF